jgi:hypothetical protein
MGRPLVDEPHTDAADWPPEHGWQIESVDGCKASERLQQRTFQQGLGVTIEPAMPGYSIGTGNCIAAELLRRS